jgi:hypothetical protein
VAELDDLRAAFGRTMTELEQAITARLPEEG